MDPDIEVGIAVHNN